MFNDQTTFNSTIRHICHLYMKHKHIDEFSQEVGGKLNKIGFKCL